MSEAVQLCFYDGEEGGLPLPKECSITVANCENPEICQTIAAVMEQVLYGLAWFGLDLRALDGITLAEDCRAEGAALQRVPEKQAVPESIDRPGTMEMARTVTVRRDSELRLHIVLKSGLALMAISPEEEQRSLAYACIAHEAAHVDHEGHLYRTFPDICGRPLECGDRFRPIFLRAMDVWSEYAACRSSASFRPEAVEEFEGLFCRTLEECLIACKERIAGCRSGRQALQVADIQQIFVEVFIHAGYFLGHLDGLELTLEKNAPHASWLLRQHPPIETLVIRLGRVLQELWLSEYSWDSIEVFAPIYDLIGAMIALHGLAFARHETEWRVVLCEAEGEP
ncbi:MAG: hypothetical protein WBD93_16870 [Acidobacteriaceae bacterium]